MGLLSRPFRPRRSGSNMAGADTSVLDRCRFISKLSPSDVENFITTGQKPANCDEVTCATVLLLECGLREKGSSINELPGLIHAVDNAVELPSKCSNLLKKIWRLVEECKQEEEKLNSFLASPVSSVYEVKRKEDPNKVGNECERVGITPHVLHNGWDNHPVPEVRFTKMMAIEIEEYRTRHDQTYEKVKQWLGKVLGQEATAMVKTESLRSNLLELKEKLRIAKRNKSTKKLRELCEEVYKLPQSQVRERQEWQVPSTSRASAKLDIAMKRRRELQKQVQEQQKTIATLEVGLDAVKRKAEIDEKRLNKKMRMLDEKEAKVKEREVKGNTCKRNLAQTVRRRDKANSKWKAEKAELLDEKSGLLAQCKQLQEQLNRTKGKRESLRVSLHKCRKKKSKLEDKAKAFRTANKQCQKQIAQLRAEVEDLESQLADKQRKINLRDGPHKSSPYTADVRATYMALTVLEVSTKKMSAVVHCVLNNLCKYNIKLSDLPGETFSQVIRQEANLVATIHAAKLMEMSKFGALHGDGTSRDGKKVTAFQVNTGKNQTPSIGLQEVVSGDSADQLDALDFVLHKMAELLSSETTTKDHLLAKLKNTMGDGARSQIKFNHLVEAKRAEVLPEVVDGWHVLSVQEQEKMMEMNHLYCNLHALIGFATYADEALAKLEEVWRQQFGQLGVESLSEFQDKSGNYAWKHPDSATQRLIRTACETVAPGGNQQAGRIQDFKDFLHLKVKQQIEDGVQKEDLVPAFAKLKVFRANRFNILFECASGLYFHRRDIQRMFQEGYVKAANKLLRAVLADITTEPLLAGCRALGLLDYHITEPYWRLVELKSVHILDLSDHLKVLLGKMKEWSKDAAPLLQQDLPPVFTGVIPNKDKVHAALFEEATDTMDSMTKQALELCLANMVIVLERRFAEHLHGRLSHTADPKLREETATMEKSNRRGENDFGYWSHLNTTKPTMGLMATEGQLLFKSNGTAAWLTALLEEDPSEYYKILKRAQKERKVWKEIYEQREKKQQEVREDRLNAKALEHVQKEKKKDEQQEAHRRKFEKYGGPVKDENSCKSFLQNLSTLPENKRTDILGSHISYLKAINPVLVKANRSIFAKSCRGDKHDFDKLSTNFTTIITSPGVTLDTEATAAVQSTLPNQGRIFIDEEEAKDRVERIKANFVKKASEVTKEQESDSTDKGEERGGEKNQEVEGDSNANAEEGRDEQSDSDVEESEEESDSDAEESEEESDSDAEESEEESHSDAEESEEESHSDAEESEEESESGAKKSEKKSLSNSEERTEKEDGCAGVPSTEKEHGGQKIAVQDHVIVAYEDDWAVGQVTKLENSEQVSVKFMERTRRSKDKVKKKDGKEVDLEVNVHIFYWPPRCRKYLVDTKFILTVLNPDRIQVCESESNSRMIISTIRGWEDIQKQYTSYYNKYFARQQPRARRRRKTPKRTSPEKEKEH
ncbi:uncharacterized protein LOC144872396 [Branchiostoma floridae x Branchiostoma japonicum]